MYNNNFAYFVRYNIRDSEILRGFEQKLGYVDVASQMYHISCGLASHVQGTLKLAELAMVNYCHHEIKRVVPNIIRPDIDRQIDGALVLLPKIGMHNNIGSIDITSLYPSAIRSLNISPEKIIGQFTATVDAQEAIQHETGDELLFEYNSGKTETKTAKQWRERLLSKKWAVSGYGTVFNQNQSGIIPSVLSNWFATRKQYQANKKQAIQQATEVLVEYTAAKEAAELVAGHSDISTLSVSVDDTALYYKFLHEADYADRLQYVFKIKLNSLYGALSNLYFRFYDLRMGESTTATGRAILRHQCRTVARLLDGDYNVDFPLYETEKECAENEVDVKWALHGKYFNSVHQSESVIYGDTDSVYFKTHQDTIEKAIEVADAVAAEVNSTFKSFMEEAFLCQPEFSNFIKAAREVVSDNGIFVQKKRYALHLVDVDGKPADKIKVMGLDTKKTILPKQIADKLNSFVEEWLKGCDWDEVAEKIVAYKDLLVKDNLIVKYGLPTGVNGVDEYTSIYLRDGLKAKLPGGVAAAIHYNEALKKHNDIISMPITSGMKIKKYYLKHQVGKFKTIALPTDLIDIPDWFKEYEIDNSAMILRLVDNPVNNIVKAVGKAPPTHQTLLDSKLVEY